MPGDARADVLNVYGAPEEGNPEYGIRWQFGFFFNFIERDLITLKSNINFNFQAPDMIERLGQAPRPWGVVRCVLPQAAMGIGHSGHLFINAQ